MFHDGCYECKFSLSTFSTGTFALKIQSTVTVRVGMNEQGAPHLMAFNKVDVGYLCKISAMIHINTNTNTEIAERYSISI